MEHSNFSRGVSPVVGVLLFLAITITVSSLLIIGSAIVLFKLSLPDTVLYVLAGMGVLGLVGVLRRTVAFIQDDEPLSPDTDGSLPDRTQDVLNSVDPGTELVVVAEQHSDVYRVDDTTATDGGRSIELTRPHVDEENLPLTHIVFNDSGGSAIAMLADPVGDESLNVAVDAVALRD